MNPRQEQELLFTIQRLVHRVQVLEKALEVLPTSLSLELDETTIRVGRAQLHLSSKDIFVHAERSLKLDSDGELILFGAKIIQK